MRGLLFIGVSAVGLLVCCYFTWNSVRSVYRSTSYGQEVESMMLVKKKLEDLGVKWEDLVAAGEKRAKLAEQSLSKAEQALSKAERSLSNMIVSSGTGIGTSGIGGRATHTSEMIDGKVSSVRAVDMVLPLVCLKGHHIFDVLFNCTQDARFTLNYDGGLTSEKFQRPDDQTLMSEEYLLATSKRLGVRLEMASPEGYLQWVRPSPLQHYKGPLPYEKTGIDPVCDAWDTFKAGSVWFRDQLLSQSCGTMPRERALGFVLGNLLPHFRHAGSIHESSPNDHGISKKLEELFGSRYVSSQYSPTVGCGETIPGKPSFSLNLEKQHCVLNESYDIVVTQDVFEHIYDAESAFREIGRTLKPGGFHIPMPAKRSGTFLAAQRSASGVVKLYASPEVHGNPMGGGALLTRQWGYDIVDTIEKSSGMKTNIVYVESELLGIVDAEYREVLISRKSGSSKAFPNIWKQLDAISPSQSSFVTCTMLNESKV